MSKIEYLRVILFTKQNILATLIKMFFFCLTEIKVYTDRFLVVNLKIFLVENSLVMLGADSLVIFLILEQTSGPHTEETF